jgi:hypothetical protein
MASQCLLIPDTYAEGWHARAHVGQQSDTLLCHGGKHRLRVEYLPAGFVIGRRVSAIGLLVLGVLAAAKINKGLNLRTA